MSAFVASAVPPAPRATTSVGAFDRLLQCEFRPKPKRRENWYLLQPLSFTMPSVAAGEGSGGSDAAAVAARRVRIEDMRKYLPLQLRDDNGPITVPEGFECDLASVPRVLWFFVSPWDIARAAVIHDYLYRVMARGELHEKMPRADFNRLRKHADDIFYECMTALEPPISGFRRSACYCAVRVFGGPYF